jgi:Tfp pilus assembly protein PilV
MFPALPAVLLLLVSLVGLALIRHCQRKMREAQRETLAAQQATRAAEGRADRLALGVARYAEISNAWKSYALGYEVFCEATYEGDELGVVNAGIVIAAARSKLQALGQYDA